MDEGIISIQIRTDLIVRIQGIPWNLTKREAAKITSVVSALTFEVPLPTSHQIAPPARAALSPVKGDGQ